MPISLNFVLFSNFKSVARYVGHITGRQLKHKTDYKYDIYQGFFIMLTFPRENERSRHCVLAGAVV